MQDLIFKDGFDFAFYANACDMCNGRCCKGQTGTVFLSEKEQEEIANLLKVDLETFRLDYCRKIEGRYSLKEIKQSDETYNCLFLDKKNQCEIYEYRPEQCKTFPFWDSNKDKIDLLQQECIGIVQLH
jgi:Fe-S-cluster containining protein